MATPHPGALLIEPSMAADRDNKQGDNASASSVSWDNGGLIKSSPDTSQYDSAVIRAPMIPPEMDPHDAKGRIVSRTAVRLIAVVFPV